MTISLSFAPRDLLFVFSLQFRNGVFRLSLSRSDLTFESLDLSRDDCPRSGLGKSPLSGSVFCTAQVRR
jgi:hypothetical protein